MRKERGLSLIELLVTMGIMSLMILILHSVFSVSLRGWKKSDNILQASTIARVVLDRMSREISAAVIDGGSSYYCLGYDVLSPSGLHSDNQGDEFYFIAPINPGDSEYGYSDLCEVGYWLGLDADGKRVLRRFYCRDDRRRDAASPDFDFNFSTGRSDEFSQNISDLQFEFFKQDGSSVKFWDSRSIANGAAPAGIKITIKVEVGKGASGTNPDFISKKFSTYVSFLQ